MMGMANTSFFSFVMIISLNHPCFNFNELLLNSFFNKNMVFYVNELKLSINSYFKKFFFYKNMKKILLRGS